MRSSNRAYLTVTPDLTNDTPVYTNDYPGSIGVSEATFEHVDAPTTAIFSLASVGLAAVVWLWWPRRASPRGGAIGDLESLLLRHVAFYAALSGEARRRFAARIRDFLSTVRVSGAGCDVTDLDRVLVAASAQMLLHGTDEYRYPGLREVLLHPTHFGEDGAPGDPDEDMLGLVGEELLSSTVVLSREDLHAGFAPGADLHVGLHEFAHWLDRLDGAADGVPEHYLPAGAALRWRRVIDAELQRVRMGRGWLDPYAAEDAAELFAVATEHYFLWPRELRGAHGELYGLLRGLYG